MTLRSIATFRAALPEDGEWSREGDPVVPPGRTLADAIVRTLRERALAPTEPTQHSFYGWAFAVGRHWCLLQHAEDWLLMIEDRSPLLHRLLRRRETAAAFATFLDTLRTALESDPRLSAIEWYTRAEYERAR